MSITNNLQIISHLLRHDISHAMIKILEEQHINDEDLQTMDRDDIEHLFKNKYGFTFRDRKKFWNVIQKFQSTTMKHDIVYIEQEEDESPDIYEVIDDEPSNYHLTQHYIPSSERIYNHSNTNIQKNIFEESSSEKDLDDNVRIATTSLSVHDRFIQHSQLKLSSDFQFEYPVELPIFSSKIIKAFETNNIESEWQTLMDELAQWILSKKLTRLEKHEHQAIGQTLFKKYPSIGKDGFRPWSYLCKCLTQSLRKERRKRGLLYV